jgi:beta-galactosidase GanA
MSKDNLSKSGKSTAGNIPHLAKQGNAIQLVVDGKPFLILGGELGNSSASSLDYIRPIWPKLVQMNLNTVLAPVYWEFIEPQEGKFDFTLVDGLIAGARRYGLRLVLLWFGSWKNSMSCYVPQWVKTDQKRFPRARLKSGQAVEILSAFSNANLDADVKAFAALMRHIHKVDGKKHTVIMIQVENEIGMLGDARDYSDQANKVFKQQTKEDETFMAEHYAKYVNKVAEAGKAQYPLPMFVNAALNRPNYKPGQYPSAGPLPHLFDIWKAAAPSLDFLAPDIYFLDFAHWCKEYHRTDNPLFIPETGRDLHSEINVFYAIGQHNAMGFCPFSIESVPDPENSPISQSYKILSQLTPLILEKQGSGAMAGVLLDKEKQTQEIKSGRYTLKISHDYTWEWSGAPEDAQVWPTVGGIIISTEPNEYVIAGTGLIITFAPNMPDEAIAGIESIQEGMYVKDRWVGGRWLNGDESHQGRHLRLPFGKVGIQRIKLYCYR